MCGFLNRKEEGWSVDEIHQVHFSLFINLPVSRKGATAIDVACHRTDKVRVFDLLVKIADEVASRHVAGCNVTYWFLYFIASYRIKDSYHAIDATFLQNRAYALIVLVNLLGWQQLRLLTFVAV